MHRGILVVIGVLFWIVGLGVALPPLGTAYVSTNYLLPILGTIFFVPAIAKRNRS
jgi:hypothetical protein